MVNDLRNRDYASFYLNALGLMIPGVTGLGMLSKADEAYDGYRLLNNVDNISDSRYAINYTDNWIDDAACFNSFSADTTVVTDKGDVPISQIQIGDFVLAWNAETNEITFELVTDTIHHTDEVVVYLTIDGEEIETTPEHPFYVEGAGWTDAEDLKLGDEIRNADGETGEVESITIEEVTQEMYNLTVDEAHTFFVGDGQWLVHNCAASKFNWSKTYTPKEWAERNAITEKWVKFQCAFCAGDMQRISRQWSNQEDVIAVLHNPRYGMELFGPGHIDVGAPAGWHMVSVDRFGNVWDNWGFQGPADEYFNAIQMENPNVIIKNDIPNYTLAEYYLLENFLKKR